MTEQERWFRELQVERTIKALKKNNFDAGYVPSAAEALKAVFSMIPDGATVGVGGSQTLHQISFFDEAKNRPFKLLNPVLGKVYLEEYTEERRKMAQADVYCASSNAVTEDGKLYNVDASGNRVGAMSFGPKKVILVCGVNKIVRDLEEAERRVREWAAPMNAKRLSLKTPCVETGVCADCSSPQRICNIYSVIVKKPLRNSFTVLLVGEPLGF